MPLTITGHSESVPIPSAPGPTEADADRILA